MGYWQLISALPSKILPVFPLARAMPNQAMGAFQKAFASARGCWIQDPWGIANQA
jgi:hypothetical protein